MRILLDEAETGLTASCVGDAVRRAAALAGEKGRMIVEIEVDGVTWTEEDLATPEAGARPAAELRLQTAHPAELIGETFTRSREALAMIGEMQREAAKFLQSGESKKGYDHLLEALAVWAAIQTGLTKGLALGVLSVESVEARGVDVTGSMRVLEDALRGVKQSLVNQDETALCDCLLYEFPPVIARMSTLLEGLEREAARAAESAR